MLFRNSKNHTTIITNISYKYKAVTFASNRLIIIKINWIANLSYIKTNSLQNQ